MAKDVLEHPKILEINSGETVKLH